MKKLFSLKWLGLLILAGGLVACGDNSPAVSSTTSSATTAPATTASVTTVPASATRVAATTTAPATTTSPATTASVMTTVAATSAPATTSASTTAPASGNQPDEAARGLAIFKQQGCAGCHGGDKAVGALGPALNNINFPEAGLLRQVRSGAAPMPAFSPSKLPDGDVHLIYVYLTSLKTQK